MDIVFLYLYILPDRIWYLKFLLEGYDGMALLTTIDRDKGLIRLSLPRARYSECMHLLHNLADGLIPQEKTTEVMN